MDRPIQRHAPSIGVSPAYFVSRYGDRFTAYQVADALEEIATLGFGGFQLEVYHRESLTHWLTGGTACVRKRSLNTGLPATQFVAHFLMENFASPERLDSDDTDTLINQVLEIVTQFDGCRVITVPVGPFSADAGLTVDDHQRLFDRLAETIEKWLDRVAAADCRLALEILPGSLIVGTDGFLRLCERVDSPHLGFNFDTGHAWASKENIYLIPAKLGSRILGTHLCDNLGHMNVSLRPGAGSIDWPTMVAALKASGYEGAFDLEIICPSKDVQTEYCDGKAVIEILLRPETAAA